jgi:hypothetical protein
MAMEKNHIIAFSTTVSFVHPKEVTLGGNTTTKYLIMLKTTSLIVDILILYLSYKLPTHRKDRQHRASTIYFQGQTDPLIIKRPSWIMPSPHRVSEGAMFDEILGEGECKKVSLARRYVHASHLMPPRCYDSYLHPTNELSSELIKGACLDTEESDDIQNHETDILPY